MSEFKERAARPAQDNDDAYSGSSYMSDEYTLPGGSVDDDARSIASASSYESYDSFCPRERLPSYRVPRDQGTSQPVYEAWVLCMSHENDHEVTKLTSCGFDILSAHDEERPFVVSRTEAYEQQELSGMTLASVNSYHAANKRGFAARLLRGRPKTYEQDLDERLRKLPVSLQSNLNGLLRNREEATSNRFRRRDWTVAMMREQYRYRFASAAPEPVKKKGLWKGKDSRRVEYLFVIRGAEGRVAADDKGMYQPREFGNPWKRVDEEERQLRERSKDIRRFGKECVRDGWFPRPRGRSLSPMPNAPGPVPRFQDCPPQPREVVTVCERGRPFSRSRSQSRSRSRSPSYPPPKNECLPHLNPFVPLPVPMGGMPPLPPTPGPYLCPTPGRYMAPPYVPAGNHLPPFALPPFEPCMRSQLHGPPHPSDLAPEPCEWPQPYAIPQAYANAEPLPRADQLPIPIPIPVHHAAAAPYPFEMSSPPQSPRASSFHCVGGAPPAAPPPGGFPTMEACHRLFDAEFAHDSDDEGDEGDDEKTAAAAAQAQQPDHADRVLARVVPPHRVDRAEHGRCHDDARGPWHGSLLGVGALIRA
ncbi:hypothetical protein INS49_015813 [Diaporthe citri]|uniref:uncharacterized protein n=1 Tax=Diaporthe citri TaxID=83186 RepID=UPI001C80CFC4|nr:uncharacterized protein INS49_015813 [Diaporthe citri]KAG6356425.1 hypothetical protein INS49_015813 [Diaporthe citri]